MEQLETSGRFLLDIAEQTLQGEILPEVPECRRAVVLMIASAMRMSAREMAQSGRLKDARAMLMEAAGDGTSSSIVTSIREGVCDADKQLHTALWIDAVIRTSVSKPSMLSRSERMVAGLPPL